MMNWNHNSMNFEDVKRLAGELFLKAEKATPGPFEVCMSPAKLHDNKKDVEADRDNVWVESFSPQLDNLSCEFSNVFDCISPTNRVADAEFIISVRNNIPKLMSVTIKMIFFLQQLQKERDSGNLDNLPDIKYTLQALEKIVSEL